MYPALLAILNNIAAHVQNLGRATSSKLLQLFASMSSPSFLLANENNHTLLQSLLEVLNAIVEHQYSRKQASTRVGVATNIVEDNPNLIYAIVRSRRRFQALREFTLESGQEELERQNQLRKENSNDLQRTGSIDSLRSPTVSRTPTLGNVPEENSAFAIGDDDDSDAEEPQTEDSPQSPVQSQPSASRAASIASSIDESVPTQVRGMSEKARGKMPVGKPTFSRQNSMSSISGLATPALATNEFFIPSTQWVRRILPILHFVPLTYTTARILALQPPPPHHPPAYLPTRPQDAPRSRLIRHSSRPSHHPRHHSPRHRALARARASLRMVTTLPRLVRVPALGLRVRTGNARRKRHSGRLE